MWSTPATPAFEKQLSASDRGNSRLTMATQFVSNKDRRPWHSNTQVRYLHLLLSGAWKIEWSYNVYFADEAQTHGTLGLVPSVSCLRDPA